MKPDERALLIAIAERSRPEQGVFVRDICHEIGIYKRNLYLLGKWERKNWYDYGVSLDLGWLTPTGIDAARAIGARV
jgi:hypothetical protein